ncbi:MAG TPA: hypothetical protein VGK74_19645 [Symbiobacteriaceae bacterium]|jgi:hypothetical protein
MKGLTAAARVFVLLGVLHGLGDMLMGANHVVYLQQGGLSGFQASLVIGLFLFAISLFDHANGDDRRYLGSQTDHDGRVRGRGAWRGLVRTGRAGSRTPDQPPAGLCDVQRAAGSGDDGGTERATGCPVARFGFARWRARWLRIGLGWYRLFYAM